MDPSKWILKCEWAGSHDSNLEPYDKVITVGKGWVDRFSQCCLPIVGLLNEQISYWMCLSLASLSSLMLCNAHAYLAVSQVMKKLNVLKMVPGAVFETLHSL